MWSVDTIDWQKPTPNVLNQSSYDQKFIMVLLYLCIQHVSTAQSLDQLITQMKAEEFAN